MSLYTCRHPCTGSVRNTHHQVPPTNRVGVGFQKYDVDSERPTPWRPSRDRRVSYFISISPQGAGECPNRTPVLFYYFQFHETFDFKGTSPFHTNDDNRSRRSNTRT